MHDMQSKIKKWGNSLGVRIPKAVIDKLKLTEDSRVEIDQKNGAILIIPIKTSYNLDDLVAGIDEDNQHHSNNEDSPVGKEVW